MASDICVTHMNKHGESIPLAQCLTHWAREYDARVALVNESGERLSYSELQAWAERLAGGLYAAGLRSGDHAMTQMPNTIGFFVVFFALLRLGAIPVMAMPNQREQDINALMELARPAAYFIADHIGEYDCLALAARMKERHDCLRLVVVDGTTADDLPGALSLEQIKGAPCPQVEIHAGDTALLLLSGGTTGTPKMIARTHGDYFYNFTASADLCGFSGDTVYLAVLPAAHNFALACPGALGTFRCGGTVVATTSASCDEAMPLIEREGVTHVALVPPLAKLWVEGREWENSDLSSLKLVQVGGARLEAGLAMQLIDTLGCQLQQVFGMAEGLLCYTRLDDPLEAVIHTQGRPLSPEDEIRIVDDEDKEVEDGQVGQLLARGPYTIRGYYRAPVQNASSFTSDGFYRSGDLVRREASGNLTVEGRIKEQINRSGEKISAAEVEVALSALHGVHAAVVVGAPDNLLGERICAFIKPGGQAIDPSKIKSALREHGLSDYKVPDQIETITEWPLTAARKIDKRRLVSIAVQRTSGSLAAKPLPYQQVLLPIRSAPFDLAVKLAHRIEADNYVLYEHQGEWALGLDCAMEIAVDTDGTVRRSDGKFWQATSTSEGIEQALADLPFEDWRAYGRADFEFAYLMYGVENAVHPGPLLKIMIPRREIRIRENSVQLRALSAGDLARLKNALDEADAGQLPEQGASIRIDVRSAGREHYQQLVASAVAQMQARLYQKVILSHAVDIPVALDMVASYRAGRQSNTPARSFLLKDGEFQAYGFSPEIVVTVDAKGNVTTQPLAGTRSLTGNRDIDQQLRRELESDVKEIAEHAVSVKLAFQEMSAVCREESVCVDEFMNVLERGSVQHLASHVTGVLAAGASAWTAFENLFPAVTASGIPKKEALESINRHEGRKRGLYSGCVLIADSDGALDATLVLRSAYRNGDHYWLQAGAGLVPHSTPQREWEETCEKLTSVGPYLYALKE
ncbi:salicylate synthase [Pollutimonas bauzanensis]|uniref:Yersiniabactin salicyl-AMP ligase n=1 Tax=Pollutimonas bauzanensis TaxID=658167 RepID=A0A1M5ZMP7_9BURK|nr:salicylate synthase [Pollutimonas bauzanensis]SHI25530.1 yersiniabactin salicyl-AMP ligase [Pollutimonas bauzanensis]